ncbi:MAG: hypothetical protein IJU45_00255 [Clostridia bacterium]|nr:hypothetical protein [Clostridia bacterium]
MSKKDNFEDDGRTVADMSGIERQPLILPRLPKKAKNEHAETENENPWEENGMNKGERRAFISGAMTAALLVGLVFAAAIGIVIFLITRMN